MPWGRWPHGRVREAGLVHVVYVEGKEDRVYWTSQCAIQWADRENRDRTRAPKTTKARATCLACLYLHLKHGWTPWPG